MPLKYLKPSTPGQRGRIALDFAGIGVRKIPRAETSEEKRLWTRVKKGLQVGKKQTAGRNNQGHITARHRGGGHKRNQRYILFKRHLVHDLFQPQHLKDVIFIVRGLVYDPARAANLALVSTTFKKDLAGGVERLKKRRDILVIEADSEDGEVSLYFYIIAPQLLECGQTFSYETFESLDISPGKCLLIEYVPLGSLVHNVEIHKRRGGQLARAAGTYAQIIEKSYDKCRVRVRLPSGAQRWILFGSLVTFGSVSNEERRHIVISKAGRNRWLSKRPKVRGVAMNPVDHPHGGGEGRTSGGRPSVTPWGRPTHGFSLRAPRKNPFVLLYR